MLRLQAWMVAGVGCVRSVSVLRNAAGALALVLTLMVAGCGGGGASDTTLVVPEPPAPEDLVDPVAAPVAVFTAAAAPARLSAWNLLLSDGKRLTLHKEALPYALNTPLFSDYSHKLRTVWIPKGSQIAYTAQGPLEFPVGAVVTKTFFYPKAVATTAGLIGAARVEQVEGGETIDLAVHHLIETRLMVREAGGRWGFVTYVWDSDQQDATLVRTGQNIGVELVPAVGAATSFTYAVPTEAQCATCHVTNVNTGTFEPIGPVAGNLNRDYAYTNGTANQLDALVALQMLTGLVAPAPRMVVWNDPLTASVEARARAYLDVNCASCHNAQGRSGDTGLWLSLSETEPLRLGVCKPPVGGQQHMRYAYDVSPGDADASFLYFRIGSYRPGSTPPRVTMPELGRHLFHDEANALVRDWINGLLPSCGN